MFSKEEGKRSRVTVSESSEFWNWDRLVDYRLKEFDSKMQIDW